MNFVQECDDSRRVRSATKNYLNKSTQRIFWNIIAVIAGVGLAHPQAMTGAAYQASAGESRSRTIPPLALAWLEQVGNKCLSPQAVVPIESCPTARWLGIIPIN